MYSKSSETTACPLSINVLVLKEHLPGERVVPLLYIKDTLYSYPLSIIFNRKQYTILTEDSLCNPMFDNEIKRFLNLSFIFSRNKLFLQ